MNKIWSRFPADCDPATFIFRSSFSEAWVVIVIFWMQFIASRIFWVDFDKFCNILMTDFTAMHGHPCVWFHWILHFDKVVTYPCSLSNLCIASTVVSCLCPEVIHFCCKFIRHSIWNRAFSFQIRRIWGQSYQWWVLVTLCSAKLTITANLQPQLERISWIRMRSSRRSKSFCHHWSLWRETLHCKNRSLKWFRDIIITLDTYWWVRIESLNLSC